MFRNKQERDISADVCPILTLSPHHPAPTFLPDIKVNMAEHQLPHLSHCDLTECRLHEGTLSFRAL